MGELAPWKLSSAEADAANGLALIHGDRIDSTLPEGRRPTALQTARERLRNACRSKTIAALNVLHEVMMDPNAPPSARIKAATEILDRGWGKPGEEPPEPAMPLSEPVVRPQVGYRAHTFEEWRAMADKEMALAALVSDPAMRDAVRLAAERGHSPDSITALAATVRD